MQGSPMYIYMRRLPTRSSYVVHVVLLFVLCVLACLCCCWHGHLLLLLSDASILKCVDATQAPATPLTFPVEFKLSRGDYGFNLETCWEFAVRIFERDVGIDRIVVDQAAMCFMFACVRDWLYVCARTLLTCT